MVFDSHSTDLTVELARAGGARVLQRRFDDYGSQREAALRQGEFKHEWVLMLDADERVDEALAEEIRKITEPSPQRSAVETTEGVVSRPVAYRMRRKDYFMGRWIKHSTLYPSWFVRLLQWRKVHYPARAVHEYPEVDGPVEELKGHLLHEPFAKGLEHWWDRHRRYAELEAEEVVKELRSGGLDLAGLVSSDPVRRRRSLKALSHRLPARPALRLLYMTLLRGGLLDGWPGLKYCSMIARYQYLTDQHRRRILSLT